MLIRGVLPPSICSQIQKCLKLIREGGGQHFSNKSEIQKSLKYPIGGGGVKPFWDIVRNFPVFLIMTSPLRFIRSLFFDVVFVRNILILIKIFPKL